MKQRLLSLLLVLGVSSSSGVLATEEQTPEQNTAESPTPADQETPETTPVAAGTFAPELNSFAWHEALNDELIDAFVVSGEMQRDMTSPGDGKAHAIIGISNASTATAETRPTASIHMQYNGNSFSISLLKGDFSILGTRSFTEVTTPELWKALQAWQDGTPLSYEVHYLEGRFLLTLNGIAAWHYVDSSPEAKTKHIGFSCTGSKHIYTNTKTQTPAQALAAQKSFGLIENATYCALLTTEALPTSFVATIAFESGAFMTLSSDGKTVRLSHPNTIATSTGNYVVALPENFAAPFAWWICYEKGNIAFGSGPEAGANALIAWDGPETDVAQWISIESTVVVAQAELITPSLNWQSLTSTPHTLGITEDTNTLTTYGLGDAVAYAHASDTSWKQSWELAAPDEGRISCDIVFDEASPQKMRSVTFFFASMAKGAPLYSVTMQHDGDAGTRIFASDYTSGSKKPMGSTALVSGHAIAGRYTISYADNTILVNKESSDGGSLPLASIPLINPRKGIVFASCASMAAATISNVVTAREEEAANEAAPASTGPALPSQSSFTSIIRSAEDELSYNWNHTALQYSLDNALNGFVCETDFTLTPAIGQESALMAIGFAPAEIDTTKKVWFNLGSKTEGMFGGASHTIMLNATNTQCSVSLYKPTAEGVTSPRIKPVTVEKNILGTKHHLWISYELTDTYQIISIGIDTPVGTSPLWTMNDAVPTQPKEYVKKIGLSSWSSNVRYENIMFKNLSDAAKAKNESQSAGTPLSGMNSSVDGELAFNWGAIRTPLGAGGGMLSVLAHVDEINSSGYATMVCGLSSDPESDAAIRVNGQEIFKGADYIISLQISEAAAYVSARKAAESGESDFINVESVPALKAFVTPDTDGSLPTKKLFVGVEQYGTTKRIFKLWLPDATGTSPETTTPLWQWEEAITDQTPALTTLSMSGWATGITYTAPVLTPQEARDEDVATTTEEESAVPSTLTNDNTPIEAQWNDSTKVQKLQYRSRLSFTAQAAGPDDMVVLAFSTQRNPTNNTPDGTIVMTNEKLQLFEGDVLRAQTSIGALKEMGRKYWISFETVVEGIAQYERIALGGYTSETDERIEEPYIEYALDTDDKAQRWMTYGTRGDAAYAYLKGDMLVNTATATPASSGMGVVLRSGRRSSIRPSTVSRVQSTAEGTTNTAATGAQTTDTTYNRRFRMNTIRTAR